MKVLITSQAALGHFHPLAAVAASLAQRRHDVLFTAAPCFVDRIRSSGFDVRPAGMDWSSQDLTQTWPEFREVPLNARNEWINANLWGDRIPRAMLPDLLRIAEDWRPDVILSGRAEIAGPSTGELIGIPYATVSAGRVIALSEFLAQIEPGRERFRADWDLPPDPDGKCLYRYLYLNFIPSALLPADRRAWPTRHHFRPATFDDHNEDSVPPWIVRLPPRSVIYVSFGANQGRQLTRVFKVVIEAVKTLSLDVIVTVSHGGLTEQIGRSSGNVHILEYLPQRFLMERAALVVCHGGVNTILGALTHRVPLLLIPTAQSDQLSNAKRCESLGVGLALDSETLSVESVTAAAARIFKEQCFREAADQFGEMVDRLTPVEHSAEMVLRLAHAAIPQLGGN